MEDVIEAVQLAGFVYEPAAERRVRMLFHEVNYTHLFVPQMSSWSRSKTLPYNNLAQNYVQQIPQNREKENKE